MQGVQTDNGILWGGTTVKALCLDLDGTIRYSKTDPKGFIKCPDDIVLFPGVEAKLREYLDSGEWLIFGISNQGGVATGFKTWQDNDAELDATVALFEQGNPFYCIKCCFHHPDGKFPFNKRSLMRKPNIGMLVECETDAFEQGYLIDWDNSLFVGDRPEDEECAHRAGMLFQTADAFFSR